MAEILEKRKQIIKDIITRLHKGLSVQEAKEIFQREIGDVSSSEIFEVEQSLIEDGLSPDEIKKFCNVHALLFESSLKSRISDTNEPNHPVNLFKSENREIEKIISNLKDLVQNREKYLEENFKNETENILLKLKNIEIHYMRKEQVLFPYLEKTGFYGPSKVMWGKDNDIREILRNAATGLRTMKTDFVVSQFITPLVEEIEGMIYKEENILFPTCLEKLKTEDWVQILKESADVGYVFIQGPKDIDSMVMDLRKTSEKEATMSKDDMITLPSGSFSPAELLNILNTMPVDITFVDKDDTVRYYSEGKDRIFVRTRSVIGRKVQNCHPPQSVHVVEKILQSFKDGTKDFYEFWINLKDRGNHSVVSHWDGSSEGVPVKVVYIRYFAVRDANKNYLGTLEVTQDITGIKKLEGEKRLMDESKA